MTKLLLQSTLVVQLMDIMNKHLSLLCSAHHTPRHGGGVLLPINSSDSVSVSSILMAVRFTSTLMVFDFQPHCSLDILLAGSTNICSYLWQTVQISLMEGRCAMETSLSEKGVSCALSDRPIPKTFPGHISHRGEICGPT